MSEWPVASRTRTPGGTGIIADPEPRQNGRAPRRRPPHRKCRAVRSPTRLQFVAGRYALWRTAMKVTRIRPVLPQPRPPCQSPPRIRHASLQTTAAMSKAKIATGHIAAPPPACLRHFTSTQRTDRMTVHTLSSQRSDYPTQDGLPRMDTVIPTQLTNRTSWSHGRAHFASNRNSIVGAIRGRG